MLVLTEHKGINSGKDIKPSCKSVTLTAKVPGTHDGDGKYRFAALRGAIKGRYDDDYAKTTYTVATESHGTQLTFDIEFDIPRVEELPTPQAAAEVKNSLAPDDDCDCGENTLQETTSPGQESGWNNVLDFSQEEEAAPRGNIMGLSDFVQ